MQFIYEVIARGKTGTWFDAYVNQGDAERAAAERRAEGWLEVTIERVR